MRKAKKWLYGALATLVFLTGCQGNMPKTTEVENTSVVETTKEAQVETKQEEQETQIFTDSIGRTVELPKHITKIAPSGGLAQMILYSIAPDKMVGWSNSPSEEIAKYFSDEYKTLPMFGTFYGKKADLNKEALIAAAPQVIIDLGEIKENMKEDLDKLQEQIGIPVIFIESTLKDSGTAYRTLGKVLGLEQEAEVLANYCDDTIKEVTDKVDSLKEDEKVTVYYGESDTGLSVNPKGSFHAEVIDLVGGNNVAVINDAGKGENQVTMEQLFLWNPDVILMTKEGAYDKIEQTDMWSDLKAVKEHRYYEIPALPYNWIDRPPAINRILGVKWVANLLYPDKFQYDMAKEAKEFYKLFYRYDLSDEEAKELLMNAE